MAKSPSAPCSLFQQLILLLSDYLSAHYINSGSLELITNPIQYCRKVSILFLPY
ncbi:MAG: hypothetical protein F6J90_21185 [Moorea sp. SIOASIH]|nr:hypothetical protein [Moorena sp. SIOASIH]